MRIVLSIIGAGSLLCTVCQAHSPATTTSPAAAIAAPLTTAIPSKVIFGGYVGQQVANSAALTEQEDAAAELEKLQYLRLYQQWKKKRMKF